MGKFNLINIISESWGWIGIEPQTVVGENAFGNLMVEDIHGQYWRIIPEECSCEIVASDRNELDEISTSQEFLADWHMLNLVELANATLGNLPEGKKYCLKIPGFLGGKYSSENLGVVGLDELIALSGDIAFQVKDLPEGATVRLKVVD